MQQLRLRTQSICTSSVCSTIYKLYTYNVYTYTNIQGVPFGYSRFFLNFFREINFTQLELLFHIHEMNFTKISVRSITSIEFKKLLLWFGTPILHTNYNKHYPFFDIYTKKLPTYFLHLIFVHLICPVGYFKCFVSHKGQVETNPKVLLRSQTICTSSICTMVKIYYFYIYISYKPFLMLSFY